MKKTILVMILAIAVVSAAFAAANWYDGKEIVEFSYSGLMNVSESDINNVLYKYRHKTFSDELFARIQEELYGIDGIDFFTADAEQTEDGELRIVFGFYEIPKLADIVFKGNENVKNKELSEAVTAIAKGTFVDPYSKALFETAKSEIVNLYESKGYQDVPVEYTIEEDAETNTYKVCFSLSEGLQTRIVQILFSGNEKIDTSALRKQVSSKTKSLFNNGYLDMNKINSDANAIASYYQTNGYIDIIVGEPVITHVESSSDKYDEVTVTFPIIEGLQWFYGGMTVSGNTIFSDEEVARVQSMKVGDVLNMSSVQADYSAVADLYYNEGFISNGMNVYSTRDDTEMTVSFYIDIVEGPQATVQEILISGLDKTKEYVMRRELEIHPGELFSKEKLVTSAQNLYNTGLLEDLDYDLMYGSDEKNVILEFKLKEGSTKDIQFGATFGGTLNGFPVSAFVQWADHNLGGRGQEFNVSSTISPDTQNIALSFGDSWFKDYRWSNSVSLNVSHTKNSGELQLHQGLTEFYNGRNADSVYPVGFSSAEDWAKKDNGYPKEEFLMDYDLYSIGLSYGTGYTFIYTPGRLTLSGSLSVSLNHAVYDPGYMPYEKLIYQYGQKWQFSNKFSFGVQWDGRDYVTNTTKGYVLSTSATYAGGLLGGLSNYIKLSSSAAGYLKLFTVHFDEEKDRNIMLCASTSASIMLSQFYNYDGNGWNWYDPKYGATKYEMLYIDGMTIGRGFNTVTDQAFLWDNMLEISYPLVQNVIQAEAFVSATGVNARLTEVKNGINWYYAAGAGIKLKIAGFPLGLYLVKNATYKYDTATFSWLPGDFFHGSRDTSGMSLVLAISTSLI